MRIGDAGSLRGDYRVARQHKGRTEPHCIAMQRDYDRDRKIDELVDDAPPELARVLARVPAGIEPEHLVEVAARRKGFPGRGKHHRADIRQLAQSIQDVHQFLVCRIVQAVEDIRAGERDFGDMTVQLEFQS